MQSPASDHAASHSFVFAWLTRGRVCVCLPGQIDKDRSGKITVDEMTSAISELGLRLNDIQAEELIFRMDIDGDGE